MIIPLGWLADLLSNIPLEAGNARAQRRMWNFIGCELVEDATNGWLTITTTGDPTLPLEASTVTAQTFQSPTGSVGIFRGAQDSATSIQFRVASDQVLTLGNVSGSTALGIPATRGGFRLGWNDAADPPSDISIEGQDAEASSGAQGGQVIVRTGAGDTGQVGGDMLLDLREDDGTGQSAELAVGAGSFRVVTIAQRGASLGQIDFGPNGAPVTGKVRGSSVTVEATGTGVDLLMTESGVATTTWGVSRQAERKGYVEVATPNATPVLAAIRTPEDDSVVHVSCVAVAYQSNTVVASYERKATFRKAAGVVTKVGATSTTHTGEDTAGWDFDIVAGTGGNQGNIMASCTGGASAVTWKLYPTVWTGGA